MDVPIVEVEVPKRLEEDGGIKRFAYATMVEPSEPSLVASFPLVKVDH